MSALTPKIKIENGEGWTKATIEGAFQHTDGGCRVNVWWSEEDDCWIAKLHDEDAKTRPVILSVIGTGDTQLQALADLTIALYVTLMPDSPRPPSSEPTEQ